MSPKGQAPRPSPRRPLRASRLGVVAAFAFLAVAVAGFTGGWAQGELTLDGPGVSLWLRFLLRHWHAGHGIPAWIPDIWAGTPAWNVVAAFPVVVLLPFAATLGPDQAVKLGVLAGQVVGAWGAFVLARSLWSRAWPALGAGLIYGLHPFFAAAAFSGHQPFMWVFAVTPWLAWSLRRALRSGERRHVVVAGLLVGFALVEQAELAYPLVLLCGILVAGELARARHGGSGSTGPRGVLVRAGAVVLVGLGIAAHWLVPFLVSSKSFILTPPEDVRAVLEQFAGALGREPGAFLHRAAGLGSTYDFLSGLIPELADMKGAAASSFYLSWVGIVLTLITIIWLARRSRRDRTLNAILLVSAAGIWLSMGTVSLSSGGLAEGGRVPALVILGLVAGLLVGNFLRSLELYRMAAVAATAAAVFLLALPFITPVVAGQRLLPFFGSIRFPRFYPLAALGVALGAAYPFVLLQRWAGTREPRLASLLCSSACLALAGAFLVDIHPYRSFYRVRPPEGTAAYSEMSRRLAAAGGASRVAVDFPGDPQRVAAVLDAGRDLSVGWPHHLASKALWRISNEVMPGPGGYRDSALGLSNTAYLVFQGLSDDGGAQTIQDLTILPNPSVLPLVRAYEQAVVVADGEIAPELAVSLSGRYIGVVSGRPREASALGSAAAGIVGASRPCDQINGKGEGALAGEVAMACALHNWVARPVLDTLPVGSNVGGRFQSTVDGLRGITVWLDRVPGHTELALHELGPDLSVGREVRRTEASSIDGNGMALFSFDTVTQSAGQSYLFLLSCHDCRPEEEPRMIVLGEPRQRETLVVGDRVQPEAAAFSPVYEQLPPGAPPATEVRASRSGPGRWQIAVSGSRPSLVVVADSYFPGWRAEVDGKDVQVMKADGAFLGVPVDAGQHEVTLVYRDSPAVWLGYALTGLTLVVCVVLLLAARRTGGRMTRMLAHS